MTRFSGTVVNLTNGFLERVNVFIKLYDARNRLAGGTSYIAENMAPRESRAFVALTSVTEFDHFSVTASVP